MFQKMFKEMLDEVNVKKKNVNKIKKNKKIKLK